MEGKKKDVCIYNNYLLVWPFELNDQYKFVPTPANVESRVDIIINPKQLQFQITTRDQKFIQSFNLPIEITQRNVEKQGNNVIVKFTSQTVN